MRSQDYRELECEERKRPSQPPAATPECRCPVPVRRRAHHRNNPSPFKSRIKSDRFLRFGIRLLIAPVHQIGKKVAQHGFRVGMHVLGSPAYAREMGDSQRTPERPISISGICAGLI
jgi:hypothetical protein